MKFGIKDRDLDDAISNSLLQADMTGFVDKMKRRASTISGHVDEDLIQLERERIIRSQLNSSDGEAVDLHDQVW